MTNDQLIAVSELPKYLPTRPHIATCYRWVGQGVRGVRLSTQMIGGRRYTTQEDLEQFFADIETKPARPNGANKPPQKKKTKTRKQRKRQAKRTLDRAGIK